MANLGRAIDDILEGVDLTNGCFHCSRDRRHNLVEISQFHDGVNALDRKAKDARNACAGGNDLHIIDTNMRAKLWQAADMS